MKKIKCLLITLFIVTFFTGFTQEDKDYEIPPPKPKQLTENFTILDIHIVEKKQIKKHTREAIIRSKKRFKQRKLSWYSNFTGKKIPWMSEKPKNAIETYIIEVLGSANYSYFIISYKTDTTSNEKIVIGNQYEMELNMIRYMGEIHGFDIKGHSMNGALIPLPRNAWKTDLYVSPNLQGLYYVK